MPAVTFHYDCRPDVANDAFKTVYSKFPGTCGKCGGSFAKGDMVAYFPDSSAPPKTSGAASEPEIASMRKELAELKQFKSRAEQLFAGLQVSLKATEQSIQQVQFKVFPELLAHMPPSVQEEVRGNLARPLRQAASLIAAQTEVVAEESADAF